MTNERTTRETLQGRTRVGTVAGTAAKTLQRHCTRAGRAAHRQEKAERRAVERLANGNCPLDLPAWTVNDERFTNVAAAVQELQLDEATLECAQVLADEYVGTVRELCGAAALLVDRPTSGGTSRSAT